MSDPLSVIRSLKKKGYHIELSVDSSRPVYSVNATSQQDVHRIVIPIDKISAQKLFDVVRGN